MVPNRAICMVESRDAIQQVGFGYIMINDAKEHDATQNHQNDAIERVAMVVYRGLVPHVAVIDKQKPRL